MNTRVDDAINTMYHLMQHSPIPTVEEKLAQPTPPQQDPPQDSAYPTAMKLALLKAAEEKILKRK